MKVSMIIMRASMMFIVTCKCLHSYSQTDTLESLARGRNIFNTSCSPCHDIHKELVGPMLASISKKQTKTWLQMFIHDSQSLIASGDVYANEIYARYHHQVMPSFSSLSEQQLDDLLLFIQSESVQPADRESIDNDVDVIQEADGIALHGKVLFQNQCLTCHHIQQEIFGPALGSVSKRHPKEWLKRFIRNSAKVINSGDPYAVNLFNAYDHKPMVSMEFLSDDDINNILKYIEFASSSPSYKVGVNGRKVLAPRRGRPFIGSVDVKGKSGNLFRWLMLVPAVAAILILIFLGTLIVKRAAREETGIS